MLSKSEKISGALWSVGRTFTKPDDTRSVFTKQTKVCIYLLAFPFHSSCKGSIRQERKLLRSVLILKEAGKQEGTYLAESIYLSVCSTEFLTLHFTS